jgi:hypothetical protein
MQATIVPDRRWRHAIVEHFPNERVAKQVRRLAQITGARAPWAVIQRCSRTSWSHASVTRPASRWSARQRVAAEVDTTDSSCGEQRAPLVIWISLSSQLPTSRCLGRSHWTDKPCILEVVVSHAVSWVSFVMSPCPRARRPLARAVFSITRFRFGGFVVLLCPPHTSLFCRNEYTSASTMMMVSVRISAADQAEAQPWP